MFSGTVFTQCGDPGPDVALPRSCWDVFHHVDGTTPIGAIAERLGFSDAELFAAVRQLEAQGLIEEDVMTYGEYETHAASADRSAAPASPAASEASGDAGETEDPSVPEEKTAAFTGDEAPPVDSDVTHLKGTSDDDEASDSVERAASDVAETVASDPDASTSESETPADEDDAEDGAPSTLFMDDASAPRGDGTAEQPSEPTSSESAASDTPSSESAASEPTTSEASRSNGTLTTAELNVEDITDEVLEQRTLHVPSLLSWLREAMSNEKDFRNVKAFVLMEASDVLERHDITDVDDLEAVDHFDDPDAILALEKAVRNNVHERIPETCYQ